MNPKFYGTAHNAQRSDMAGKKQATIEVAKGDTVFYVNAEGEKNVAFVAKVLNGDTGSVNLHVIDEDGNGSNQKSVEFSAVDSSKHEKMTPHTWHYAE